MSIGPPHSYGGEDTEETANHPREQDSRRFMIRQGRHVRGAFVVQVKAEATTVGA